jgi:hypothetical protein
VSGNRTWKFKMIIVIVFTTSIELFGVWAKGHMVKSEGEN